MGKVKEYFLEHIDEYSDEQLSNDGYSQEDIDFLKNRTINKDES